MGVIHERLESHRRRAIAVGACATVVIGVVAAVGSSIGAQDLPVAIEPISVVGAGSTPVATFNGSPALSDSGAVVAFAAADLVDRSDQRVWIRDRASRTTIAAGDEHSAAPGISGDGCVVAYSVFGPPATGATTALVVVDRCRAATGASLPSGAVIDTVRRSAEFSAPALSTDGSTIVWSTGREIRRFERAADTGAYVLRHSFDVAPVASPDAVTGGKVDVSADGSTVAFVAGPGSSAFAPSPPNVYVWDLAADTSSPTVTLLSATVSGAPGSGQSGSPTMSDDGTSVVFDSVSPDLAAISDPVVAPILVRADIAERTSQVLIEDAARPALSGDGLHVAFHRGDAIEVLSSPVQLGDPATSLRQAPELDPARPETSMAMSRFGRWLVFDRPEPAGNAALPIGSLIVAADMRPSSSDPVIDSTTTTPPVTSPTTTTVADNGGSGTPTPTTAPAVPPSTVPVSPPVVTWRPSTTRPSTPSRTVTPSRSTTSPQIDTSVGLLSVQPPVLSFEPTIVDAGRRTAAVSVTNSSGRSTQVGSVELDSTEFTIESDACSGAWLGVGSGCDVTIVYAPTEIGPTTGQMSVVSPDGVLSVMVTGTGSPAPTLEAVPAVVSPGQVVTVFGGGFPAGVTVEISRSDVSSPDQAVVGANGAFVHTFVVPGHAPAGPMTISVAGQPDLHGDVTTEALVTNRGAGSNGAAFRDRLVSPFGG